MATSAMFVLFHLFNWALARSRQTPFPYLSAQNSIFTVERMKMDNFLQIDFDDAYRAPQPGALASQHYEFVYAPKAFA